MSHVCSNLRFLLTILDSVVEGTACGASSAPSVSFAQSTADLISHFQLCVRECVLRIKHRHSIGSHTVTQTQAHPQHKALESFLTGPLLLSIPPSLPPTIMSFPVSSVSFCGFWPLVHLLQSSAPPIGSGDDPAVLLLAFTPCFGFACERLCRRRGSSFKHIFNVVKNSVNMTNEERSLKETVRAPIGLPTFNQQPLQFAIEARSIPCRVNYTHTHTHSAGTLGERFPETARRSL